MCMPMDEMFNELSTSFTYTVSGLSQTIMPTMNSAANMAFTPMSSFSKLIFKGCYDPDAVELHGKYRFQVGARVKCKISREEWVSGTVVLLDYREPSWPVDKTVPYQVQLDTGSFIFAPGDSDDIVKGDISISNMGVKQLRAFISSTGHDYSDCVEKADLRVRALQVMRKMAEVAASAAVKREASSTKVEQVKRMYGGYECLVQAPKECLRDPGTSREPCVQPDVVLILLHGYGALNKDFLPLLEILPIVDPELCNHRLMYVLPAAPCSMLGVSQWWSIDWINFACQMLKGEEGMAKLVREVPEGLPEARTRMMSLVEEVCKQAGNLPFHRVMLGGFSQCYAHSGYHVEGMHPVAHTVCTTH
ncbi:hypothetical protein CYMTET_19051 [Cymbomonas tetramitiformis]|uniref:Uncharacterized protein n=1 Tax=Cymbomonas tetramitiformis TaxID=36881 RepID=A0AAE0G6S7_9CHLO|nr:hypothetical protein CYMTET_19051 [Cymbomonas tetramitiformis]